MKVKKSKRKHNTVSLDIEVSVETINKGIDLVFKKVVKTAKVPGFRKGKVTRAVFEKHYGTDMLIQDGLSEAVNMAYIQAIKELDLSIVDYPKNVKIGDFKPESPVSFTCEVDVKPEIKVDKYKGVKVEKESIVISDDLIQAQINQLMQSEVDYSPVDRPVEKEDLLKVTVKAFIDDAPFSRWTKDNVGVGVGSSIFSENFDTNLIGLKANEEHSFGVDYTDDYYLKDVAGKTVQFTVLVTEVKGKVSPELTDEFAKKVSKFDTVDALKANIRDSLESQRKTEVDEKLKEAIMSAISDKNSFDIPSGMIEQEVEHDKRYYENMLKQSGATLDSYLGMLKQSEADFEAQLKETAEKRVKSQLILEAIEKKESIQANEAEIKSEIKRMKPDADTDEKIEAELQSINQDGLKKMISQRKVFEFLIEHAKIKEKTS